MSTKLVAEMPADGITVMIKRGEQLQEL